MSNSLEKFFGTETEKENVNEIIQRNFRDKLLHAKSLLLPENPLVSKDIKKPEDEYRKILKEYMIPKEVEKKYNKDNPENAKGDFIDEKDLDIGWKFHLNIRSKHVKAVSDYLVQNGYCHKYLSGGDIDDGKIFTIYTGSHKLAKKLAQSLSSDLYGYLCKPVAKQEVEFEAGIIGRFVGPKRDFARYGSCGYSIRQSDNLQLESLCSRKLQAQLNKDSKSFEEIAEKMRFLKKKHREERMKSFQGGMAIIFLKNRAVLPDRLLTMVFV